MSKTNRRIFLRNSLGLSAAAVASTALGVNPLNALVSCSGSPGSSNQSGGSGNILQLTQAELPYAYDALEPHIDARTMEIHYSRHHKAYVDNANGILESEGISYESPEALLANISQYSDGLRNNAGGAWNHSFFWESLRAGTEENAPSGALLDAINSSFGSFDTFKEQFKAAGLGQFGSGWAWLVKNGNTLSIGGTPNQDNPLMDVSEFSGTPLLGIDVWEHAYYLKYQNQRGAYIDSFWNIVNWDFVAEQFG